MEMHSVCLRCALLIFMSYEEEDTCMSYEEEDTCMSYEEEDTCMSYEEEDTCLRCDLLIFHCSAVKRDLLQCQKRPITVVALTC